MMDERGYVACGGVGCSVFGDEGVEVKCSGCGYLCCFAVSLYLYLCVLSSQRTLQHVRRSVEPIFYRVCGMFGMSICFMCVNLADSGVSWDWNEWLVRLIWCPGNNNRSKIAKDAL